MSTPPVPPSPQWREVFDAVSAIYDQSGVPFFGPIAQALAERLAVAPGERVAELGCGRGALTLPLAASVGSQGRVDAVELSPQMAALATEATAGLPQVSVVVGDAAEPPLTPGGYDVVAASLVIFFLPDPVAALRRWRELVVAGGRAGVTTFATPTPSWAEMEAIFQDVLEPGVDGRDLRGGVTGPFGSDAGVEGLFQAAGWREVETEVSIHDVPFGDLGQWEQWVQGTALRSLWVPLTVQGREQVLAGIGGLLDREGGRLQLAARHTLARR